MLAIEAAVVHCVTSMQDNIEKKLARLKHSYSTENAGSVILFCIWKAGTDQM